MATSSKVLVDKAQWDSLVAAKAGSSWADLSEDGEEKSSTEQNPRVRLLAHPAMAKGLKANKPVMAYLSYYSGVSGAANTAFAANFFLQPNQDTSWASWQAVFDEVKVVEAEAIWNTYYTTDPSSLPANSSNSILVYEPTGTINLASVNAGLQFERYSLCRNMIPSNVGAKVSPVAYTKDGFLHFKVKLPKGTTISSVAPENSTGNWRPTDDVTNYNWGKFITYTSVGGTSAVLRVEVFVRMLCEFRVRR